MRLAFLSRRPRRIPLHARIIAAVVAVCVLVIGLDALRTWQMRDEIITADYAETANLARSLAQHAYDTLDIADVVLSGLREQVETDGLSPERAVRLERLIAMRLGEMPMLCGIGVFDAEGSRVVGERTADGGAVSVRDRPYFEYHRTHADRDVHVGDPIRSRVDGQWSITVSRRIDDPHGRFAGVVRARIPVAFLREFYGTFAIGSQGVISLASTHGSLIARTGGFSANVGLNLSSGPVFRRIGAGERSGSFRFVSPIDGIVRLGSFRRVDKYPLYILVGHPLDRVLSGWRVIAWRHLAINLLISVVLAMAGSRVAGQVRIRQQVERRYRLLAENSSDAILCLALDGSRLYVSPAFAVLTGWSVEEVTGERSINIVHPDDQAAVSGAIPRLLAGAGQVTVCFRYICKDRSLLWVEGRARLLQCPDGEIQIISNVRDITDRRAAEAQVVLLNRELAEQANTDGLTGLANRRRFDEVLAQGWRQALRDAAPLSLLMIDVDRFKLFNDRYGHLRGDECLRAVAAAAAAQVAHRRSCIAARYGGEEFVVLLPGVDAAGAAALAGRVLESLRAAGIEHEDNIPTGVVTVSIGVATASPSAEAEASDMTALLARADAALYEAKRCGRNRTVTQEGPPRVVDRTGAMIIA